MVGAEDGVLDGDADRLSVGEELGIVETLGDKVGDFDSLGVGLGVAVGDDVGLTLGIEVGI